MGGVDSSIRQVRQPVRAFLLSLLLVARLSGQGVFASITGSLKDGSGALVPDSSVIAQSVESGRRYATLTNDAGIYTGLRPFLRQSGILTLAVRC